LRLAWLHHSLRFFGAGISQSNERIGQVGLLHHLLPLSRAFVSFPTASTDTQQGFGITIGSDFYLLLDHRARQKLADSFKAQYVTVTGTFLAHNATAGQMGNWTGSFSFTNQTTDAASSADLSQAFHCQVPDYYPWWRKAVSPWWQFLLVPLFSTLLSLSNLSRFRSREFPVMIIIGCIGWLTNTLANHYIFNRSDVVSFIGAFVIGILGNMYSRILR
jgi:hypothetical protein